VLATGGEPPRPAGGEITLAPWRGVIARQQAPDGDAGAGQ
jgi:hypothetical protein